MSQLVLRLVCFCWMVNNFVINLKLHSVFLGTILPIVSFKTFHVKDLWRELHITRATESRFHVKQAGSQCLIVQHVCHIVSPPAADSLRPTCGSSAVLALCSWWLPRDACFVLQEINTVLALFLLTEMLWQSGVVTWPQGKSFFLICNNMVNCHSSWTGSLH